MQVMAFASFSTFSAPILAPVTRTNWKPACRESYVATVKVKVFKHMGWACAGTKKLVETETFKCAALEFGEDLLS